MYKNDKLFLTDLTVDHLADPIGIDDATPCFAWKLNSDRNDTVQSAYRLVLRDDRGTVADTGAVAAGQSIEVTVPGFTAAPMTRYHVAVSVTDNYGRTATLEGRFETGRMGVPFSSAWAEPVQQPTPSSMGAARDGDTYNAMELDENGNRTFGEFRPAQYVRIPFRAGKGVVRARIYATTHGLYRLTVNGACPDERLFAPENTAYNKLLLYQTYDVTDLIRPGENVIGAVLADGWWVGRVGTTGDCCQYGDTTALLLDAVIEYTDGTRQTVTGDSGVSHTGPIVFSDLFVGEKYDARLEMPGWDAPGFDGGDWTPVQRKDYDRDHLKGQGYAPVRALRTFKPAAIVTAPNGDILLDAGQNLAGFTRFTVTASEGTQICLEHFEQLDRDGNVFNSILNNNKEQTEIYICREGTQTFQPSFTYHGFRYVRVTGWPGMPAVDDFRVVACASEMRDIGSFSTSDPRLNQLQSNIWWSQVSNTVSIPTDCPQREKAGWTGDIMAYAPTLCFNRDANAFLSAWMDSVRAEQMPDGAVPMIVPYLKAYATFLRDNLGADTSCGWGDAVVVVPWRVYQAYGNRRILEDNYEAMTRWMAYIDERARNHHPEGYEGWDDERKERSRWLWNTDFHFGDWLIPSIVLGNPDAFAMNQTAYATMGVVAPAYYAFSAKTMSEIAAILGRDDDARRYAELYQNIREAFIAEYVHADGTMDANFQGIYVIALQMGLVPEDVRPRMVEHLCQMIHDNGDRLDTGFLSVLFLMDVLCDNGRANVAYKLLFQEGCPGWLYEVRAGATTLWESWGAISEDGSVSTYSYNHYAFGCVGEWMYRHIGGLQRVEPGYRRFRVKPSFVPGLTSAAVSEETPYGRAAVEWRAVGERVLVHAEVPANARADVELPGMATMTVGSGSYDWLVPREGGRG